MNASRISRPESREPWAVVMEMDDGSVVEQVCATRMQAEMFLYLLPYAMTAVPDGERVKSAILSPLQNANITNSTDYSL